MLRASESDTDDWLRMIELLNQFITSISPAQVLCHIHLLTLSNSDTEPMCSGGIRTTKNYFIFVLSKDSLYVTNALLHNSGQRFAYYLSLSNTRVLDISVF